MKIEQFQDRCKKLDYICIFMHIYSLKLFCVITLITLLSFFLRPFRWNFVLSLDMAMLHVIDTLSLTLTVLDHEGYSVLHGKALERVAVREDKEDNLVTNLK